MFFNKADRSSQSQQNHVFRLDNKTDKAKENTRLKVPADENSSNDTRINRGEESITSAISHNQEDIPEYNETRVPVVEERLSVNKVQSVIDLTITKEPVTETTSIEVPVTYEEITIQRRRPVNKANAAEEQTGEGPVHTRKEIKIPLMKEEIEISKQPYVKEEVIIRKKPVIETRTVTEEVKSEKVKVKRGKEEGEEKR